MFDHRLRVNLAVFQMNYKDKQESINIDNGNGNNSTTDLSQEAGANINVTNIPGPQFPLYTGGAQLLEVWPFAPLYPSMGLGVAVVSYNGDAYFGLSADPVALQAAPDGRLGRRGGQRPRDS